MAYAILDNYPEVGCIAWIDCHIVYKGVDYEITNQYTDAFYVWWDFDYPNVFQAGDEFPELDDDDVLVFLNKNGTHLTVPTASVVDGGLIVPESIHTNALAANSITGVKILAGEISAAHLAADSVGAVAIAAGAVTAEKINVENLAAISANLGTVNAGFINVGDKVLDITDMATAHDGQVQNDANVTAYFPFDDSLYDSKNLVQCTFNRDSVAYLPNGAQVAPDIARYDTARIVRGVMIEEGTTNLLTANQSNVETDTSGLAENGVGTTVSRDTTTSLFGNASLKVVTVAATGHGFITNPFTNAIGGQTYTASVYLKGNGTVSLRLQERKNGTYSGQTESEPLTLSDTWQRLTVTATIGVDANQVLIYVGNTTASASIYWADALQIEQKYYATSWILGGTTRAPEVLTIPTAGVFQKGNWTVELTYTPKALVNDNTRRVLWRVFIDANNYYSIVKETTGEIFGIVISNGVSYTIYDSTPLVKDIPTSIMFCGDGAKISLYKDGLQIGDSISYIEPLGDLPPIQTIGVSQSFYSQCNGIIDELRFSKVARTLEDHQAYYNSQKGYTDDETIIRSNKIYNNVQINSIVGVKCSHEDGSYTQMKGEGFKRFVPKTIYTENPLPPNRYTFSTGVLEDYFTVVSGTIYTSLSTAPLLIRPPDFPSDITRCINFDSDDDFVKLTTIKNISKDCTGYVWVASQMAPNDSCNVDILANGVEATPTIKFRNGNEYDGYWVKKTLTFKKGLNVIDIIKHSNVNDPWVFMTDIMFEPNPVEYVYAGTTVEDGKEYAYLTHIGTIYCNFEYASSVGSDTIPTIPIQLPEEFKNKDFKIVYAVTDAFANNNFYGFVIREISRDISNGIVYVQAFSQSGSILIGLTFSYFVIV